MSGRKVARIRRELGLTQAAFATLVHVTQPAVSQWEAGLTNPTAAQAELIRIKVAEARQQQTAPALA